MQSGIPSIPPPNLNYDDNVEITDTSFVCLHHIQYNTVFKILKLKRRPSMAIQITFQNMNRLPHRYDNLILSRRFRAMTDDQLMQLNAHTTSTVGLYFYRTEAMGDSDSITIFNPQIVFDIL